MSQVTLLLGASLRRLHPESLNGEIQVEVDGPLSVKELLGLAGIAPEKARILLLNHKKAFLDTVVRPGDRLAVFPPELAFNMYVALELAHSGQTEEDIAAASETTAEHGDPDSSQ